MASVCHGTRVPSSQGARDHGNKKIRVVYSHGAKVANGPSVKIANRVVLSPGAKTPRYLNLFDEEIEPLQSLVINLGSPLTLAYGST
jgi:hypothetical protein